MTAVNYESKLLSSRDEGMNMLSRYFKRRVPLHVQLKKMLTITIAEWYLVIKQNFIIVG